MSEADHTFARRVVRLTVTGEIDEVKDGHVAVTSTEAVDRGNMCLLGHDADAQMVGDPAVVRFGAFDLDRFDADRETLREDWAAAVAETGLPAEEVSLGDFDVAAPHIRGFEEPVDVDEFCAAFEELLAFVEERFRSGSA